MVRGDCMAILRLISNVCCRHRARKKVAHVTDHLWPSTRWSPRSTLAVTFSALSYPHLSPSWGCMWMCGTFADTRNMRVCIKRGVLAPVPTSSWEPIVKFSGILQTDCSTVGSLTGHVEIFPCWKLTNVPNQGCLFSQTAVLPVYQWTLC